MAIPGGAMSASVEVLNRLRRSHAAERRRIARTLHDQVAHSLGVALNNLEMHEMYGTNDPLRAQAQLSSAVRAVRSSLESVRALCFDLRRREVGDGLEEALTEYLRSAAPADVEWSVQVTGNDSGIPDELRDELYLTLREATRNSLIHAGPHRVEITVQIESDAVRATENDDGRGFDIDRSAPGGGLASMRERVQLLGGNLDLSSTPGVGTSVQVHIPLGYKAS